MQLVTPKVITLKESDSIHLTFPRLYLPLIRARAHTHTHVYTINIVFDNFSVPHTPQTKKKKTVQTCHSFSINQQILRNSYNISLVMSNTKAYGAVFLIRLIYAIMQILMKATFNKGVSTSVFVFYRQSVATLFLVPVVFLLERKRAPPLQYKVALKIFALAFCGISGSINIYNIGLNYTTATMASAMFNVMPVFAFILAVLFGMETVKLNRVHGMVKAFGIVLCLGGVITLALYRGPELKLFTHRYLLHHTGSHTHGASSTLSKKSWVLGVFLMVMSTAAWALWVVLQGPVLLEYPSKLLNTVLQCLFSTVQSFFLALIIERDFSRWKIGMDVSLISVIYCGIIVSGVSYYLQSWTIEKRGPVFLAMSMPLTLVITIILSTILLGEAISLGSVLGGVLLVGGLYNVLWGKRIETLQSKKEASNEAEASSAEEKGTQV